MTARRRHLVLPLVAAALSAAATAPLAAGAEPRFRFEGGGFGHGVGMPQYGAYGAARAGWGAPRILGYFYRGAQLATIQPGAVRALITSGRKRVQVSSASSWQIVDEQAQPPTALQLAPGSAYTVTRDGAGFSLADENGVVAARVPGQARLQPINSSGALVVGARGYRGAIRLVATGEAIDVVNVVDIEQYLQGVVPREMPSKWGNDAPAALQAQAVAARTYAVAGLRPDRAFDLYPDQRSQVYGGVTDEDPRTTAAITATQGQVLIYNGRPISAFFFSSSGGRTEDVKNVFPSDEDQPYLVSVPDPFDRLYSPHHRWSPVPTFTGKRLGALLGTGAVRSARVLKRGQSGRVIQLQLTNRRGDVQVRSGAQVRRALGLRDTLFQVVKAGLPKAPTSR